jgi:DNA-binding PadR family transcriptional regulator
MLDLALLGLLKERPMHGYDLRKRLREDFGVLANLSFGSLYPALARLEAGGAVRPAAAPDLTAPALVAAIPSTGSLAGERAAFRARQTAVRRAERATRGTRGRKVYEVTARGDELFSELLAAEDQPDDARSFDVKLAFARHLSPDARLRLLERRLSYLEERLSRARRSMAASRPLDPYKRSLAEHASDVAKLDISWLERLIDAERGLTASAAGQSGRAAQ